MIFYNLYKFMCILVTFASSIFAMDINDDIDLNFPANFSIGTATSAFQTEGAWNLSGKSPSIWDHVVHNYPERIADESNVDIACDSYHKYKEDANLLQYIGVDHYRFSVSWARILPNGRSNSINQEGIKHYHKVLDELGKRGIAAIITIYHWDHPQILEKMGGWLNDEMPNLFGEFARIIFKEYGPRVKMFVTINEPNIICHLGYKQGTLGLGGGQPDDGKEYLCAHNMLKAHAIAYNIYNQEFRSKQKGYIGLAVQAQYDFSKNEDDVTSPEIAFEFRCGWIANPIFSKTGDYPEIMKHRIAERSRVQGYNSSKLPTFSQEWIQFIRNSADYFGLNHYTAYIVEQLPESEILNWPSDEGLLKSTNPAWPASESSWLKVVPESIGLLLRKIKTHYNDPPVFLLENGVSDGNGLNDDLRIKYMHSYMREILIAIKAYNCTVKGYTAWSLLDNFEVDSGYKSHFGLVEVDMHDKNRTRTLKKSAKWLKAVIKARKLLPPNGRNLSCEET